MLRKEPTVSTEQKIYTADDFLAAKPTDQRRMQREIQEGAARWEDPTPPRPRRDDPTIIHINSTQDGPKAS